MQRKFSNITGICFTVKVTVKPTAVSSEEVLIVYPDDMSLSFTDMGGTLIVSQGQQASGTGARSVSIGGNAKKNTIITGDGNMVGNGNVVFGNATKPTPEIQVFASSQVLENIKVTA